MQCISDTPSRMSFISPLQKGLSNEVNIRIFCYNPEDEMIVRHFVNQLETDQSLECHLKVCNLYKTFLAICDDMDITDAMCQMMKMV